MPSVLPAAEVRRRLEAVRASAASVRIDGGDVTPETAEILDTLAHGRVTEQSMIERLKQRCGALKKDGQQKVR